MFNGRLSQVNQQRKFVLVLIIGLLLSQWLVFTHVHKQGSNTPDSLCSICIVGEHLSNALISNPFIITQQLFSPFDIFILTNTALQQRFSVFHSRAPPVLL